ncbi:cell division protein SepF [Desulfofalx alkaliphila]|uniref:cell division protein SepF n=1 Tax=Desulfofalx alkaliphila TaxID=105483 RepID=UPI0004E0C3F7|nr:cell division protein SepF [Desulfofalx alkaliphila]
MSKRFMDKMMGIIGLEEEIVDDEQEQKGVDNAWQGKQKANIVSLHSQRQVQVVVVEPSTYDEVQGIADNLRNRCPVIVNLEKLDADLGRRIVDFLSGSTYALNGSMQKVGQNIFLFVPNNIDIASEIKERVREKGIFSILQS